MVGVLLVKLFVYGLLVFGMSQIISEATIFKPVRDSFKGSKYGFIKWIGHGISCFLCISVWISILSGWYVFSPSLNIFPQLITPSIFEIPFTELEFTYTKAKVLFIDGMIGSALAWFYYCFEVFLTRK